MTKTGVDKILIMILVISVLLRVISALTLGDTVVNLPGTADQISYHTLSQRVLNGFGFTFGQAWWPATSANAPTAHWSYLYTFYLLAVYSLVGPHALFARLVQAIIVGILQPYLIYKIGHFLYNRRIGLIGAALAACYTYSFYYAATLMTEPFYITVILASLYFSIRIADSLRNPLALNQKNHYMWFLGLGFCVGCAVLLRQLFLLFVPFLSLWILWCGRKNIRKTILGLTVSVGLLILLVLPVTVFNYTRFHRFVLLNTNAGFAFFWGNHPFYGTRFIPILPSEQYHNLIPKDLLNLDEAALDQSLLKLGIGFIAQDPVRYVLLSLSRIPAFFMFWPSADSGLVSNLARVLGYGLLLPFMIYGIIIEIRNFAKLNIKQIISDPIFLLLLFAFIYSAIHIMTWALIRYRLPVDEVMLVFAALAISDIGGRMNLWRKDSGRKLAPGTEIR